MADVVRLVFTIDSSGAVTGGRATVQALRNIQQQAGATTTAVNRMEGSFNRVRQSLFSLRSALLGVGFGLFARELVMANLGIEQVRSTLITASDSAALAASDFNFVLNEATRLGIGVGSVGVEFARLAAAAKGTVLEGDVIRDVFSATAEAFVATGQSSEQLRLGIFALQQMISKGRVQAEELRGQFGERLPGAFSAAARAMGTTTAGLNEMLKRGELTADELLPKLAEELRKTFGRGFQAALLSPRVAVGQFQVAIERFLFTIGQTGFMDQFVRTLRELTTVINGPDGRKMAEFLGFTLGEATRLAGEAVKFLAENIELLTAALVGLAATRAIALLTSLGGAARIAAGIFFALGGVAASVFGVIALAVGVAAGSIFLFRDELITVEGHTARVRDFVAAAWAFVSEKIISAVIAMEPFFDRMVEGLKLAGTDVLNFFLDIPMAIAKFADAFIFGIRVIGVSAEEGAKFLHDAFVSVFNDLSRRVDLFASAFQRLKDLDLAGAKEAAAEALGGGIDIGVDDFQARLSQRISEIGKDTPVQNAFKKFGDDVRTIISDIADSWGRAAAERFQITLEGDMRLRQLMAERNRIMRLAEEERRRNLEEQRKQAAAQEESSKEIDKIRDRIRDMELEVAQRERLIQAMKDSTFAVTAANRESAIEDALRKNDLDNIPKEDALRQHLAATVRRLAGAIFDLTEEEKRLEEQEKTQTKAIDEISKAFDEITPKAEQMALEAITWRNEMLESIRFVTDGYEILAQKVEEVFNHRMKKAQDQALEDSKNWKDGMAQFFKEYSAEVGNLAAETKDFFAKTFAAAEDLLVDFLTTGKFEFEEFTNFLFAEITRMVVRQGILKPLSDWLGNLVGGAGGGGGAAGGTFLDSAFNFISGFFMRNGGIMTQQGPVDLQRYAMGGVASRPTLAMFGEGSSPEAFVPLPDGRNIPVKIDDDLQRQTKVEVTIITPNADSFINSEQQVLQAFQQLMSRATQRNR